MNTIDSLEWLLLVSFWGGVASVVRNTECGGIELVSILRENNKVVDIKVEIENLGEYYDSGILYMKAITYNPLGVRHDK